MRKISAKVVQSEIDPVPVELIASSIRDIGIAARRIEASGLSERALCLLLSDSSQVPFSTCRLVLRSIVALEQNYVKKKVKGGS